MCKAAIGSAKNNGAWCIYFPLNRVTTNVKYITMTMYPHIHIPDILEAKYVH